MKTIPLEQFTESEPCSCHVCVDYCKRPCWPIPAEALRLIDAGYANRLMADAWIAEEGPIWLLCGANPGYEGKNASGLDGYMNMMFGLLEMLAGTTPLNSGCIFLRNGLCELHDAGLKPFEGRVAHHSRDSGDIHEAVAAAWNNDEGRAIIARWRTLVGCPDGIIVEPD